MGCSWSILREKEQLGRLKFKNETAQRQGKKKGRNVERERSWEKNIETKAC